MTRHRLGALRAAGPRRLGWVGAASGALHGLALLALVWRPTLGAASRPADPATLEVMFVSQAAATMGAAAAVPLPPPSPHASAAAPLPAFPAAPGGEVPPPPPALAPPAPSPPPLPPFSLPPSPAPPPPSSAVPSSVPSASAAPAVNLGDADEDRDALTVTGDVVSAGPDPRYRNKPPGYPRAALLLHEQGTVQVLIHVAADGSVERVELVASSGSAALDEAGMAAVAKWHLTPGLRDGVPAASVYPFSMNFRGHE